jgi:hypothetical protein
LTSLARSSSVTIPTCPSTGPPRRFLLRFTSARSLDTKLSAATPWPLEQSPRLT